MKLLKGLLMFVLVLVVLLVAAGGYLGLIPGVSAIFGADQPRDLGVESGPEDFTSVQEKLGQEFVEATADPAAQLTAAVPVPVDVSITQEEYAEHIMRVHPIDDVQVKLEGDTFEVSGRITKQRIPGFIRTLGFSDVSDTEVLDAVDRYLPGDPIFYLKGTASAANDDVSVNLVEAEIGRLPISPDDASQGVEAYMEAVAGAVPAFSMESITIQDGMLHFTGTASSQVPQY